MDDIVVLPAVVRLAGLAVPEDLLGAVFVREDDVDRVRVELLAGRRGRYGEVAGDLALADGAERADDVRLGLAGIRGIDDDGGAGSARGRDGAERGELTPATTSTPTCTAAPWCGM